MSRKYGPLETANINREECDIIYNEGFDEGYAECLTDMIKSLKDMRAQIEEYDHDPMAFLDSLIEKAEETLDETNTTQH